MIEIGKELEKYTYLYFLENALSRVPDDIDCREGSVIYDALAPACYELGAFMLQLKNVVLESFVQTASGQYLDLKGIEVGIERIQATKAIVRGKFLKQDGTAMEIPLGDRFSSVGDNSMVYVVTEKIASGEYLLTCQTEGTKGNHYLGILLPLGNYTDLMEATVNEITIPARDVETDDELRQRILSAQSDIAFGGNVADYIRFTTAIDGVGACQIYPVWAGGGTVLVVIVDNAYDSASETLIDKVQEAIDPRHEEGRGVAPIGHTVTVKAPERLMVDVSFKLTPLHGFTVEQLKDTLTEAIENYFLSLRKKWGIIQEDYTYQLWVFRSQLISVLMNVPGVANVQDLTLNGEEKDLFVQCDNSKQELPYLGEVVIS